MNKIILFSIAILSVFLFACNRSEIQTLSASPPETPAAPPITIVATPIDATINETVIENVTLEPVLAACTNNKECQTGEYCVNQECKTIASLYKTNCKSKCTFANVTITTSDGKTVKLAPGKGSYTAAGALEWDILRPPQYCTGETLLVPIKIYKRNYGTELGNEVITIKLGETSDVITHPMDKNIRFTLRIDDIQEICA